MVYKISIGNKFPEFNFFLILTQGYVYDFWREEREEKGKRQRY